MARPKTLTADVLKRVPTYIERGLNAAEIADAIGCTLGTLRVKCSQMGISLRCKHRNETAIADKHCAFGRSGAIDADRVKQNAVKAQYAKPAGPAAPPRRAKPFDSATPPRFTGPAIGSSANQIAVTLALTPPVVDQLCQRAIPRGISAAALVSMLLEVIVRDGLYDAVLDEREEFDETARRRRL